MTTQTRMQDVPVRNPELLTILNEYKDLHKWEGFSDNVYCMAKEHKDQRDWFVGEGHLKEIVDQGTRHEGFPEVMYGSETSAHRKDNVYYTKTASAKFKKDCTALIANTNQQMMTWLGTRNNALTATYPPGGFISWHNNANASAFNLIFTWSETGDGCFKYVDPESGETVVMEDKPGWQCKAAYFGSYRDPENLFYHAAETDCWRVTLSYTFDTSDSSQQLREDVIEDIMSE